MSRQNSMPEITRFDGTPTRTQRKIDLEKLRQLAWTIIDLPAGKFDKLPLPDELRDAMIECRRLTDLNARRRQLQFIQSIIDTCDCAIIERDLARIDWIAAPAAPVVSPSPEAILADSLLAGGDAAVFALAETYHQTDLQTLRQAVRKAQKNLAAGQARPPLVLTISGCIARLDPK